MTDREDLLGALRPDAGRVAVRFERTYSTTEVDLWSAITDPERVGRWLAPLSGDLSVGGSWRLDFGDDESRGAVVACEPPRLLVVTWDFPGEPTSRVTAEVTAVATTGPVPGARLVLEHLLLPSAQAVGYGAGWHAHLAGLRAHLDGGDHSWDDAFAAALPSYRSSAEEQGLRRP